MCGPEPCRSRSIEWPVRCTKLVGEPGGRGSRRARHHPPAPRHRAVRPPALPQEADGGVSGAFTRLPYPADVRGRRAARKPDPRLVGEHRALPGPAHRSSKINVRRREATIGSGMRLVVGHRAGRPERHDGPSLVQRPARSIASSTRCLTPSPHLGAAGRLAPRHASESPRDTRQDLRRLRWPVSSAADQRAANRDTSGADETSRAPKDSSSWTTRAAHDPNREPVAEATSRWRACARGPAPRGAGGAHATRRRAVHHRENRRAPGARCDARRDRRPNAQQDEQAPHSPSRYLRECVRRWIDLANRTAPSPSAPSRASSRASA